MKQNFNEGLKLILSHEGGYSDHPSDPGGATNMGITHAVLAAHRGRSVTKAEVKALTRLEAADIYHSRYWMLCRCDELPTGMDVAVFDCAVNQGVSRAITLLQKSVNVTADGKFGPKTLEALRSYPTSAMLLEFMSRRMNSYGLLTTLFRTFGLGWSRRLMATFAAALAMILVEQAEAATADVDETPGTPASPGAEPQRTA